MLRFADHREHLARLRAAALRAVDPALAVRRFFSAADVADAERVFVVGAGKAGVSMARAAAEVLGERLTAGTLAVPQIPSQTLARLTFIEAGHPTPNAGSLAAGRAVADLVSQTTARDLVVALISGGGSALLELPRPGLSLEDLQLVNHQLLRCGAAVHEINAVRAQLSQLKGGGLARLARPARVLALILSDVIGNRLDIIASGPTAPAASTPQDALAVIEKYDLRDHLPAAVLRHLESASSQDRPRASAPLGPLRHLESVPSVDPPPVENRLIASNRLACEAARLAARDLGFEAVFCGDDWQGEARRVGGRFAQIVMRSAREPGRPPALCFIAGGESTVAVRGPGKGGRNQEAALAAALAIAGAPNVVIAAFATDGVDGPTDAAGAVVTGDTIARARALGLDPKKHLDDNGSYPFFAALGDLIVTGPTGTNVNDLLFGLAY